MQQAHTCVYIGEDLAAYGFGQGHPFGPDRLVAFWNRARETGLDRLVSVCNPVTAVREQLEQF